MNSRDIAPGAHDLFLNNFIHRQRLDFHLPGNLFHFQGIIQTITRVIVDFLTIVTVNMAAPDSSTVHSAAAVATFQPRKWRKGAPLGRSPVGEQTKRLSSYAHNAAQIVSAYHRFYLSAYDRASALTP